MEEYKDVSVRPEWKELLRDEFEKSYFVALRKKVREAYLHETVFPPPTKIFRAFNLCAPRDIRVVILGQDPYHTPGVADGLAFSSVEGNHVPPSLQNVYKEIAVEFATIPSRSPDLTRWAEQGVLLLNASLSVASGKANSHAEYGWHEFTDALIRITDRECDHVVFMLWGNYARQKSALIDGVKHLILESPHPSPLSAHRGFLGNGHFKKANEYLTKQQRGAIDWR